jgi:hypothetical protein
MQAWNGNMPRVCSTTWVNPSSSKPTFYTWYNALTSVLTTSNYMYIFPPILKFLSLDLIAMVFFLPAALPGSRDISPPIPAMHDVGDDAHQDVLCSVHMCINHRCIPLYCRTWVVSVNLGATHVTLTHIYPEHIPNSSNASPIYLFLKCLLPTFSSTWRA